MILEINVVSPENGFLSYNQFDFYQNCTTIGDHRTWIKVPSRFNMDYVCMSPDMVAWYTDKSHNSGWGFIGYSKETTRVRLVAKFETGDDGLLHKLTW